MTVTAATKSRPEVRSEAIQLSADDHEEGVRILNELQTVDRAKRRNDPIPMAASNVVRNEQFQTEYVQFIRRVAGFEAPAQRVVVEKLLFDCYQTPCKDGFSPGS